MKNESKAASRRSFIRKLTLGTTAASTIPVIITQAAGRNQLLQSRNYEPGYYTKNDQINLATIGFGIQGIYDTGAALTTGTRRYQLKLCKPARLYIVKNR